MVPASWVWAIGYFATPLAFSIGDTFWALGIPFAIHMLLVPERTPRGPPRPLGGRLVLSALHRRVAAEGHDVAGRLQLRSVGCGRNVFAVWPDEALHQVVRITVSSAILILAVPVAIALRQHWRAAAPAARRAFLPAILAIPVNAVIAVISTVAIAFRLDVGWVADHGFKAALGGLIPAGLLVGLVQARLQRLAASLLVELGHGVPPAGLRESLARFRTPASSSRFPRQTRAADRSRRQPFRDPAAGTKRAVARVERGGKLLAVLVHDPAIDAEDRAWSRRSARPRGWRSRTPAWQPRCAPSSRRSGIAARLAQAADDERRRVERDLHDGPSSDSWR